MSSTAHSSTSFDPTQDAALEDGKAAVGTNFGAIKIVDLQRQAFVSWLGRDEDVRDSSCCRSRKSGLIGRLGRCLAIKITARPV